MDLGALADGLGCFPLDYEPYRPQSDSRAALVGIRSLVGFGNLVGPLAHPELYHRPSYVRLSLEIFRGEPAISKFD